MGRLIWGSIFMAYIGFIVTCVLLILNFLEVITIGWLEAFYPLFIGFGIEVFLVIIFWIGALIFVNKTR